MTHFVVMESMQKKPPPPMAEGVVGWEDELAATSV